MCISFILIKTPCIKLNILIYKYVNIDDLIVSNTQSTTKWYLYRYTLFQLTHTILSQPYCIRYIIINKKNYRKKHLINLKSSTIAYLSFKANNISFFQNHRLNKDTLMIQKPVNIKEISDTFRKTVISTHQSQTIKQLNLYTYIRYKI